MLFTLYLLLRADNRTVRTAIADVINFEFNGFSLVALG